MKLTITFNPLDVCITFDITTPDIRQHLVEVLARAMGIWVSPEQRESLANGSNVLTVPFTRWTDTARILEESQVFGSEVQWVVEPDGTAYESFDALSSVSRKAYFVAIGEFELSHDVLRIGGVHTDYSGMSRLSALPGTWNARLLVSDTGPSGFEGSLLELTHQDASPEEQPWVFIETRQFGDHLGVFVENLLDLSSQERRQALVTQVQEVTRTNGDYHARARALPAAILDGGLGVAFFSERASVENARIYLRCDQTTGAVNGIRLGLLD